MRSGAYRQLATIYEDVLQPTLAADYLSKDQIRTIPVLNIGRMDHGMNKSSLGVGYDASLGALDLLARVVAPRAAALRGFDALAIDDPETGRGFAPDGFTTVQQQGVIERDPQTIVTSQVGTSGAPSRRQASPGWCRPLRSSLSRPPACSSRGCQS